MAKMFQVYGIGQALLPVLPPPLGFENAPTSNQTNYEIGQIVFTPPRSPTTFYIYGGAGNWEVLASSGGNIAQVLGTTNQVTVTTVAGVATVSLPSAITTPGSLTTTTSLSSGTTVTAGTGLTVTTGDLSVLAGNANITGNVIASKSAAGVNLTAQVTNSDNTVGTSNAGVEIATGGASSGDPYLSFQISGVGASTMTMGLDNSASDLFVISNSTAIGTSNALTLSQAGALTATTSLTATLGNITATNGNLDLATAGNKIIIATGSNASVGTSAAMSGTPGVVTVATTACSATAKVFYSRATAGGTLGNVSITAQDGTGFTLTSTANETSTFNWWIINA